MGDIQELGYPEEKAIAYKDNDWEIWRATPSRYVFVHLTCSSVNILVVRDTNRCMGCGKQPPKHLVNLRAMLELMG